MTQVGLGQQVVPVAQLRCARSCRGRGRCRARRVPQVPDRCYVRRLGPEPSHKGQGAVRRHSSGANNVDHPEATTVRGDVERGGRTGSSCGACVTTGSAREHPHRLDRFAAPRVRGRRLRQHGETANGRREPRGSAREGGARRVAVRWWWLSGVVVATDAVGERICLVGRVSSRSR